MFATNFFAASNNFDFHSRHPAGPYILGIPGVGHPFQHECHQGDSLISPR